MQVRNIGLGMGVVLGIFTSVSVASQFGAGEHNSLSFAKLVCLWVLTWSATHRLKIVFHYSEITTYCDSNNTYIFVC